MTNPPGTQLGSVSVLLWRALPKRREGEAHMGPHPGLPPGEEHHYHILQACDQGRCGSHSYGSVAHGGGYSQDEEEWAGEHADPQHRRLVACELEHETARAGPDGHELRGTENQEHQPSRVVVVDVLVVDQAQYRLAQQPESRPDPQPRPPGTGGK